MSDFRRCPAAIARLRLVWLAIGLALFACGFRAPALQQHRLGVVGAAIGMTSIALPAVFAAVRWLGPRRGLASLLALSVYAYGIEAVGVLTAVPYGGFRYGTGMGPLAAGLVPLSLPLGYVPLVLGCLVPMRRAATRSRVPMWMLGALLLCACDLVLDPGAVALGYWSYDTGGAYYGVPWTNFVGWLLTGAGAVALASRLTSGAVPPPVAMATSAVWTVLFWSGVAVGLGMIGPAALGLGLSAAALTCARRRSDAIAGAIPALTKCRRYWRET